MGKSEDAVWEAHAHLFLLGDDIAVTSLERMIARAVRWHGYSIPKEDRDDLVQQVLLEVWEALRTESGRIRDLGAFARVVAYRRCIDRMRDHTHFDPVGPSMPDRGALPDEAAMAEEQHRLGGRVLGVLRETCRELMRLHAEQSLTYKEIAQLQGRTEGAVRTQMHECLKEAKGILETISCLNGRVAGSGAALREARRGCCGPVRESAWTTRSGRRRGAGRAPRKVTGSNET